MAWFFSRFDKKALTDAIMVACESQDEASFEALSERAARKTSGPNNQWSDFESWAMCSLPAWGVKRWLEMHGWMALHSWERFVFEVERSQAKSPTEHDRLLGEVWPVVWAYAVQEQFPRRGVVKDLILRKQGGGTLNAEAWNRVEEGPFSAIFHNDAYTWNHKREVWHGRIPLSPLQIAWATQDWNLCGVLLKNGAGVQDTYPRSAWPTWTLQTAMASETWSKYELLEQCGSPGEDNAERAKKLLDKVFKEQADLKNLKPLFRELLLVQKWKDAPLSPTKGRPRL